jgi:predicted transcriptional regulator
MSSNKYLTEKVNLKLDVELLDALRRLAEIGDRTVAAEMRRALRAHIARAAREPELKPV